MNTYMADSDVVGKDDGLVAIHIYINRYI